jgi:hypothetical protein
MAHRTWSRLLFVVGLSLALPASLWAQIAPPPQRTTSVSKQAQATPPHPSASLNASAPGETPFSLSHARAPMAARTTRAPQIATGQPGLSFRYVQTFGVTEQAYPADT